MDSTDSGRSLTNTTNTKGPRTLPCGMPDKTSLNSDSVPFTTTRCFRRERKSLIQDRTSPSLHNQTICGEVVRGVPFQMPLQNQETQYLWPLTHLSLLSISQWRLKDL